MNCSAPAPPAKPGLEYPSVMCRRMNSRTWVALSVSKVTSVLPALNQVPPSWV